MTELTVVDIRGAKVSSSCIGLLEDALERAKRGELVNVAIAGILAGGDVLTGWSGGGSHSVYTMLGAIAALQRGFSAREIEDV